MLCVACRVVRKKGAKQETWEFSVADSDLLIIGRSPGEETVFESLSLRSAKAAKNEEAKRVAQKLADGFEEVDERGRTLKPDVPMRGSFPTWLAYDGQAIAHEGSVRDTAVVFGDRVGKLTCYEFESEDAARGFMGVLATVWALNGKRVVGPEMAEVSSKREPPRPTKPPKYGHELLDLDVSLTSQAAHLEWRDHPPRDRVKTLLSYRALIEEIADAGARHLDLVGNEGLPGPEFLAAFTDLSLPRLESFDMDCVEYRHPELGPIDALFAACPNLRTVSLQGQGTLRPVEAKCLETLRVWDGRYSEGMYAGVAASSFPALSVLEFEVEGMFDAEQVRRLVEIAAPRLRRLRLSDALDAESLASLLRSTSQLEAVDLGGFHDLEELEPLLELGVPKRWTDLEFTSHADEEEHDFLERLLEHADHFEHLERFVIHADPSASLRRALTKRLPQLELESD